MVVESPVRKKLSTASNVEKAVSGSVRTSGSRSELTSTRSLNASAAKPFKHQEKSLRHSERTPIVFDASDPGTGKTFVRIKTFQKRRAMKQGCALVLAPKNLLRAVWLNDFKKFAPNLKVAVSTAGKHESVFAEEADVYVTNLDAVKWLAKQKKGFFDRFDELIIDESSAYKHHTSQRSRAIAKIAKFFKYRACMTGTPTTVSITDIWHQVFILDQGKRLGPSFYAFRNTVCTPKQVGANVNALQWTDKDGAEEAVYSLLSDIVIRHKFEDCVDIPAMHQYSMPYELGKTHRKAYEEMQDHAIMAVYGDPLALAKARIQGKKPVPLTTVSAQHAGILTQKLLQVASGAVYGDDGKYHVIDLGRYEMIADLIEARKHSLCFFYWKHQRDLLVAEAERRGFTFAVIDGDTPEAERAAIVERYQRGAYTTIFAHPKSAAHGLTLTKGTATIWPSPTYDLEVFKQGSKRQHRMGQTQKTENIIVVAEGTVEEKVYQILEDKNSRMTNLLDLFSTL